MPWQVPITVDGLEYPVTFNTEGEPTQQDYDEAVQQILSQKAQAAPEPEPETPGYLSQLGSALGLGYRQMKSGVGATFNALTGDTADVAAEMAEMSKLQREQQAAQTPEDMEFMRSLEEAEKGFEKAQGPLESIGALAQYPAAVFAQPGAAFKTAVQSAPNALISGATSLAGYGLGGLVGGVAGIETGPGAILTGLAGATAGGALSNTLMEAGPSIFDVLNEHTQGAASNMTADEITAYLQQNPDIVDEGLKTGAIRGSVIGAVEALGVKGSGRLLTMPERAAARAVQKELMAQGVDVASKEAVDKALLDPALRASTKAAADTAKNQFSSAGNMARLAGASAIETGAAGAGELAAQAAAGQDISTKEAFLEMMGDAALSLPMAATTKALEGAKYMLNPALVSDLGKASAENLAATGSTAAAEAQEGFNEEIELTMLPFTREDIRATEMPFTREDIRATDLPFTREDIRATQLPFGREDIRATEMPFSRKDIRGISTPAPAVEEEPQTPSPEMEMPSPPQGVDMASAPVSPIITEAPLSEGAERNRAVVAEAAAKLRGEAPQDISAGLQAAIPQQPVETQEDASIQREIPESRAEERIQIDEGGPTAETSGGNRPVISGEVQEEVVPPARDLTKPEQMTPEEFIPIGNPVNQGIFKTKKEASARLSELEETISNSQPMKAILAEFGLIPQDAYQVARDSDGRWSLGATHKHRVALAAREKLPVSSDAVDTYQITLPEGYVRQGELYVFQPQTKQAAEKQTPVPLRGGTGAAGVVQSEPVEGSIPTDEKVSPETESESSGNLSTAEAAMSYLMDDLTDAQKSKWTPEMFAAAKTYFDSGGKDFESLQKAVKFPRVVSQAYLKADKAASEEQARIDKAQRATDAEIAKAEREEKKLEAEMLKREEMRSNIIASIIGRAELKSRRFGQVTNSDAISAIAMLVASGDAHGALTSWVGTRDDFLRDPANRESAPSVYARLESGEKGEGYFSKGRSYIITDNIGVSDKDVLRGEALGVSPQVAAVRRVIIHEQIVHGGINGLPLNERRLIINWIKQNSTPEQLDELAGDYTEFKGWRKSLYQFEELAEEFLARQVEDLKEIPKDGPMAKLMDILRRIWDFIVGYKREPTLSDLKSVIKLLKKGADVTANNTLKDGGEVKLSMGKPEFTSDSEASLAAGSEAARSTLYSERDMDIREAIRRAYEAMPKTNSVAVPIGELFEKVEELMPGVTQDEFSNVLQDLFEDNGAVLQEGEVVEPLTEQDRRYLALAEDEDTNREELQRMVDEAAYNAGFRTEGFHGTHRDFSVFDRLFATKQRVGLKLDTVGNWFTDAADVAKNLYGPKVVRAYLMLKNPLRFDGVGGLQNFRDEVTEAHGSVDDFRKWAKSKGYDGVEIGGDFVDGELQTIRITFDPDQIKSADPVTRDESGNVIPLSRRFDTGPDIRGQINVTTPEGRRAGFVVVMPRAAKASRIKADGEAATRFKDDIAAIENGSFKAKFGGVQFKDFPASDRTVKPKEFYSEAAIRFVDNELDKGNSIEDIAFSIQSPDFLEAIGIENNLSAQDAVTIEVRNRVNNELRREKRPDRKKRLDKMNKRLSGYWQGTGSKAGANLGIRKHLINDPRYRWMFIKDLAEKGIAESVENVARGNMDSPEGFTDKANAEGEKASEQAAQAVFDEVESAAEDDLDAQLLREGEALLDTERRKIWDRIKDILRKLALIARVRSKRVPNAAKASISKAESDAIFKMSDDELAKLEKELLGEFDKLAKVFLGEESTADTPAKKTTRAKRKAMVTTAKKRAESGKEISPEAKEAAAIEMAENKASQIVYRFEELYRQGFKNPPEGMSKKEQKDSIIKAFRDQVKNPTSFEAFAERLANLKVGAEVAERMFLTASRERADLIRVKDFKIAKRKVEIADKQASRLIYATEERFRQGSKDLNESKDGDSINKAFRDQVSTPVSESDFSKRLAKLNVSPDVAARLFKTAAREKADLEAMEAFRMLEGPDALKNILREIERMRRGEEIPLRTPIPWRQLLSQKAKTVEEYRQRIFDAISSNEAFQNLPDDKKAKLADLFSEAWESKRKDILERMLTTLINQEEAAKRISKDGAKALREQRMKLVEDINLGILDAEEVMKRLAEKFGIKTEFTEQERQKIDSLIETVQDETLNRVKRNKAAYELLKTLSGDVKIPVVKMLADYWVASVLSGMNTATSIALAVGNGAFELLSGAYRVLTAAIMNPKEVPAEIVASFKAMAAFLKAFKREGNLAWQYLVTGDREFLDPSMNDVLNDLNYESIGRSTALAEKMAESDKIAQKVMGVWMRSVSRLLTALDSFNAGVTKTGSLPIVARQLDLNADGIAKVEQAMNLQNYKDIIIQRDFAGIPPKTAREKAVLDSWAKDEMMAELDKYGKFSENANFYGQQGAMTLEPSGLGGFFYRAIKSLTGSATTGADKFLAESQRKWKQAESADKAFQALQLGLAYFLQFGAYNSANLAGLRFARFAGNKFNQGLSFLPGIGMLRLYEASLDKTHIEAEEAFTDMLLRNQLAGTMIALAGYAMLQAISDEPDDEKRGWFINGSWANLTPEKKQQKLAAGQKEFTIGIGDKVFSYQNWPISSALAAIGGLSDLIRFSPEQWNEKNAVSRLTSAATSGVFAATEIPALSGFQTLFGNNLSSKDPNEKKLDRFANVMAGWGGGFVPRILKDFDYLAEPELRKYETLWEKTASHIPIYRRYEGKEYYDILGKQIERKIYPGSREFMEKPSDPEYQVLGKLNSRGIWLTPANAEYRMVGKGRNRRRLTQEEADAYSLETGKGYRQMLLRYGQRALQMPTERSRAFLSDKADEVRDRALKKVYRR